MVDNKYKRFIIETGQMLRFASWDRNRKINIKKNKSKQVKNKQNGK